MIFILIRFIYSVGSKLAQALRLGEENLANWCKNGAARPLPASFPSTSNFSWLSANLNFSCSPLALSDDPPFGHLSIEWLAKRIQQSGEERSDTAQSLLSCLQSFRLLLQTWIPPITDGLKSHLQQQQNRSTEASSSATSVRPRFHRRIGLLRRGVKNQESASRTSTFAYEASILATTGYLYEHEEETDVSVDQDDASSASDAFSTARCVGDRLPPIGLLTVLIKSIVACSDVFTMREQFLWLIGCLQTGMSQIVNSFPFATIKLILGGRDKFAYLLLMGTNA